MKLAWTRSLAGTSKMSPIVCKGEQGTAELGTNTVLKQTNKLCFLGQKLPFPIVIGKSKWIGSFGLAQQVLT